MATNVLRPVSLSIRASRPCSIVSGSTLLLSSGAGLGRGFRKDESNRSIVTLTGFRYAFMLFVLWKWFNGSRLRNKTCIMHNSPMQLLGQQKRWTANKPEQPDQFQRYVLVDIALQAVTDLAVPTIKQNLKSYPKSPKEPEKTSTTSPTS